jgi:hypothetical protein
MSLSRFCMSLSRFWNQNFLLNFNCHLLLVLIVCQLLVQFPLQLQEAEETHYNSSYHRQWK